MADVESDGEAVRRRLRPGGGEMALRRGSAGGRRSGHTGTVRVPVERLLFDTD
jgi:hypothetical protein